MTRFLLDNGIATDYIHRRRGVYERARSKVVQGNPVGIGVPILAELVSGIERSGTRDRNLQALKSALPSLRVWPFDPDAAFEYGRIHAELARFGRPMQIIDMMLAAIAFTLGNCTVVTEDSDLAAVPGLTVENWAL